MNDTARDLEQTLLRPVERKLDALKAEAKRAEAKVEAKVEAKAEDRKHDDAKKDADAKPADGIAQIERRMEARRESIRQHVAEARAGVERTAKSWPVMAAGAMAGALVLGYVVATRLRPSPARRVKTAWERAREAPQAARRYIHEATKPPSRVWTERLAAGTGMAMAVLRALPQLRALAEAIPRKRGHDTRR